ncbi:MAG: hypothetical protein K0U93_31000 [Gammaproteobacteria bacterium]|nr:hypothetical protein [Gammaproteobacteria bacterium]
MQLRNQLSSGGLLLVGLSLVGLSWADSVRAGLITGAEVFINEIHYDNAGRDVGEGIELAGRTGANLHGWLLTLYNGSNGKAYRRIELTPVLPDSGNGVGFTHIPAALQNGADGIALSDVAGHVIEFLSYEGVFSAVDGVAAGLLSSDIGVEERADSPIGQSLQRAGVGRSASDFRWVAGLPSTPGSVNINQTFTGNQSVPISGSNWLLALGLSLLGFRYRARSRVAASSRGTKGRQIGSARSFFPRSIFR